MHERLAIYQTLDVEVDEKNDQIALRRMRSRTGNPQE
jgi:hypothetical protein